MSCNYLPSGARACCTDREATAHTRGVWTSCDDCGHDWWCVGVDEDDMDEPTRYVCSDGCDWDDPDREDLRQ